MRGDILCFSKKDKSRVVDKNPDELPGGKEKSFILPFAGGEIWFEHLDGIYQYIELAIEKLRNDTETFRRPFSLGYIKWVLDFNQMKRGLLQELSIFGEKVKIFKYSKEAYEFVMKSFPQV